MTEVLGFAGILAAFYGLYRVAKWAASGRAEYEANYEIRDFYSTPEARRQEIRRMNRGKALDATNAHQVKRSRYAR